MTNKLYATKCSYEGQNKYHAIITNSIFLPVPIVRIVSNESTVNSIFALEDFRDDEEDTVSL